MKSIKLLALLLCLTSGTASAQSLMFPIATTGCNQSTGAGCTVWTPSQWISQLTGKQDTLGFTPLSPANNLSDVGTPSTARTNLGLGTMATQGAGTVSITGGSVTGTNLNPTGATMTTGASITMSTDTLLINKGTGSVTAVTLPSSPVTWKIYRIKDLKGDCATNNITVTPSSGTIDGASNFVMNVNKMAADFEFDGTNWSVE